MRDLRTLPRFGDSGFEVYGRAEGGDVVVRARPPDSGDGEEQGRELCRIEWRHHLHRTEIHESIVDLIARAMASAVVEARDQGYRQCQADMRAVLGVRADDGR